MALKTKDITVGEHKITITQFPALKAYAVRMKLVSYVKTLLQNNVEELNLAFAVQALASVIYELPQEILLELFKNCSAEKVGGLGEDDNFNVIFNDNLDGIIEVALEVIDLNGFFTKATLELVAKKIPMLKPVLQAFEDSTQA